MKCEDAMREVSGELIERMSFWKARRVRRHLQGRVACGEESAAMRRLERAAHDWRSDAPPVHLQDRIAAAIAQAAHDKQRAVGKTRMTGRFHPRFLRLREDRTMQIKLIFAVAALAAGAAFFSIHGQPAVAEAQILRRMAAQSQQVQTAHVVWRMSDYKTDNDTVEHHGSLDQVEEDWYQDGQTRKEGVWGSRLIVGATDAATDAQGKRYLRTPGKYYRYDPHAGKVTAIPELGLQYSRFTLEEFVGDLVSHDPKSLETLGVAPLNGRTAREISIAVSRLTSDVNHHPVSGDSRQLCWVDVQTDLPVRIADEQYESGAWRVTSQIDFEFNEKLPASLFDPATLKR